LVERTVRDREAGGSNPLAPTNFPLLEPPFHRENVTRDKEIVPPDKGGVMPDEGGVMPDKGIVTPERAGATLYRAR
jgi:hypothetical protein